MRGSGSSDKKDALNEPRTLELYDLLVSNYEATKKDLEENYTPDQQETFLKALGATPSKPESQIFMEIHLHTLTEAQHVELLTNFEQLAQKFDKDYTEKKLQGSSEVPEKLQKINSEFDERE